MERICYLVYTGIFFLIPFYCDNTAINAMIQNVNNNYVTSLLVICGIVGNPMHE